MPKRISLLLPTRGRRAMAMRFLESVFTQSADPNSLEVVLCVDEDDVESHSIEFAGLDLKEVIVARQNMGAYNSICLEHATGEITIAVNDDMIIRTKGWDEKIRDLDAQFPDGIYLAYGNDLFKGGRLCTFPILPRRTCELLSQPYPSIYRGAFIDVHLMDIFKRLTKRGHGRLVYRSDIVFEHMHYRVDASAADQTYSERPRFGDDTTFISLSDQRRNEAKRLILEIEKLPNIGEIIDEQRPEFAPPTYFSIVYRCINTFFLDKNLPIGWRTYLSFWVIARYYYCRLVARDSYG